MSDRRRGLGRGLGALIPTGTDARRPVDVFFPPADAPSVDAAVTDAAVTDARVADAPVSDAQLSTGTQGSDPVNPDAGAVAPGDGAVSDADGGSTEQSTDTILSTPPARPAGVDREEAGGDAADASSNGGSWATGSGVAATVTTGKPAGNGWGDHRSAAAPDGSSAESAERTDEPITGLLPVPGARFAELPVGSIRPNPRQPRTVFDEDAMAELVESISEIGVLQPVVVRPVADDDDGGIAEYELIMGERRWRATQKAGLTTIPAIVRETDDSDLLRDALLENLHRSQLNPLEEAAAYQQLLDDFGCTHEELAARVFRSRPQISNTLRLLRLPPLVQRRLAAGVLSAGHARALLGLADGAAIERLAQRIVAEGLSVRATEEIVSLGGDAEPAVAAVRRPRAGERNAALDDLASRLSDRFETRVKIALGRSKGRLTVEFASVHDLNRILSTLSPEDPGLLRD